MKYAGLFLLVVPMFFMTVEVVEAETTIAVLNFENNSIFQREKYAPLAGGLCQIFISELNQVAELKIVEREKLNKILDEIKLAQSGLVSSNEQMKAGNLAGAQYMVFGSFLVNTKDVIRVDIRVIEVETGVTITAAEVTGKGAKFLKIIKQLADKIVKSLPIAITAEEKKKIKSSKKMKFSALLNYSKGIACEDEGKWDKSAEYFKKALREEPNFKHVKERVLLNRHHYTKKH